MALSNLKLPTHLFKALVFVRLTPKVYAFFTRRVNGYTMFVGKYVSGRRNPIKYKYP